MDYPNLYFFISKIVVITIIRLIFLNLILNLFRKNEVIKSVVFHIALFATQISNNLVQTIANNSLKLI